MNKVVDMKMYLDKRKKYVSVEPHKAKGTAMSFAIFALEHSKDIQSLYLRQFREGTDESDLITYRIKHLKSINLTIEEFCKEKLNVSAEELLSYHPSGLREYKFIKNLSLGHIKESEINVNEEFFDSLEYFLT